MSEQQSTLSPSDGQDTNAGWMSGQEWLDHMEPADNMLFAEMRWHGDSEIIHSGEFAGITIAEAAERVVAGYLGDQDSLPDRVPIVTVYWANGAKFGPFPVEISLTIEATCLRGGE